MFGTSSVEEFNRIFLRIGVQRSKVHFILVVVLCISIVPVQWNPLTLKSSPDSGRSSKSIICSVMKEDD